jgi:hypothetical protein
MAVVKLTNKLPSEYITEFLNFVSDAKSHYKFCCDELNEQDKLTQDYLHSLELDDLKCNERSKLATKLAVNRKDRRYYKDRVEELEPFVGLWLKKDKDNVSRSCKEAINNIKNCLGNVRKQEEYHGDRRYKPRVLKDMYGE